MAVRNWWIDVEIDGRKTRLNGGPVSKDGGFSMTIYQRVEGESVEVVRIAARATSRDAVIGTGSEIELNTSVEVLDETPGTTVGRYRASGADVMEIESAR